jgi:tRNA G18 (ribose-2'-O)-methylase SpoU
LAQSIDRPDDPRLEPYRHVGDAVWLRAHGSFVAEGRLVVERLIALGTYAIQSVLVTPPAFRALGDRLRADTVLVADQQIVNSVTGFNFHRGCLALVRRPSEAPPTTFANARRLVVLEGVGNPDNVGGIFRSAAALGADGVLLDPRSGDPLYRKAVRTSMGAVLRLPFARVEPWPAALETIRRMGFALVALTPNGTETMEAFAAAQATGARLALVAGAEGPGLSAQALAAVDATVRIPVDPRSDSLNVVVAVSIALHALSG